MWRFFDTGKSEAAWNMALDEALLEAIAELKTPVLRFYGWTENAATFGYFQHYAEIAAWTPLRPLIRRTTGGGLVPHDADWTYSVIIPPSHPWYELRATESYQKLHHWVADALRAAKIDVEIAPASRKEIPGQCFAGAEQHDILLNGQKVAGAAQRRAREGLLIQGSIQKLPPGANRHLWQEKMRASGTWEEFSLTDNLRNRARDLVQTKYSRAEHNERR